MIRNNTDILCVSETWLTDQTPDSFVYIKGYKLFRKDYEFNKIGGVAIYVRDELSSNEICFDVNAPRDIEAIFINVQLSKNPSFLVSTMYRHPQGKSETYTFINSVFNKMLKQNKAFYVLGDLNDNQLKNSKSPLKSIIYKNGLKQLIETPTRVTTTSSTLIDVIITNRRDSVLSLKNTPCSIADHNIITAFINVKKPKRAPITCTYRSMKNYSKERFCELLAENIDVLNNIIQTDNVDEQVRIFTNVFQSSLDKCSPIVTNTFKRPPAPWLTEEIRSKMNERDSLLCRFQQNVSDVIAHNTYKDLKKEVKRLVKSAKRQYFRSKLNDKKNDPKAKWKLVNEIIPRKLPNQVLYHVQLSKTLKK